MLKLTLLGGFQARFDTGAAVTLSSRKAQALLAYLGLRPGRAHLRDKLAALLWADSREDQARDGLRHALATLRQALLGMEPPILLVHGSSLALSPTSVQVDVAAFERHIAEGTPTALECAAGLYDGDLLSGFSLNEPLFEEWLITERERLRELALDGLSRLLAHQLAASPAEVALQTGLRLLALDPLQEPVHRAMMRLYSDLGRRSSALRQYRLCLGLLRRELGADPEPQTRELYHEILRRPPAARPTVDGNSGGARGGAAVPHRRHAFGETPLIGRDEEMRALRAAVARVRQGHGQVVTVLGEAGIGKSSVLDTFAGDPSMDDVRLLRGRAHESEQILPFGAWVDAFRADGSLAEASLDLLPAWRAELARLLPEVRVEGDPAPGEDPRRLFDSVYQLLERLAAVGPVAVMLDDVHWADEMSIRLLAFVARRIAELSVLVIATARDDELVEGAVAHRVLQEVRSEPHARALSVSALSESETFALVRALARTGGDETAIARLQSTAWRVSQGNPFVAVEIVEGVTQGSVPEPGEARLPPRVRDLVRSRLQRLSETARTIAAVAAIIGREAEFALLRRAAQLDDAGAAQALEELVRRRVLREVGERFAFTHERILVCVADEILLARRSVLHRQTAAAIEELYADDLKPYHVSLGLHYREAAVWDRALTHWCAAGRTAMSQCAFREAARCFEQALAVSRELPSGQVPIADEIDLRLDLRFARHALGDFQSALESLVEAEGLAREANDARRLAMASACLCHHWWIHQDPSRARDYGERAVAVGASLNEVEVVATAEIYLGKAAGAAGDYVEAAARLRRATELFLGNRSRQRGRWLWFPAIHSRVHLAVALAELGEFHEGIDRGREAIALAEELDHAYSLGLACLGLGVLLEQKGDVAEGTAVLERGVAVSKEWELGALRHNLVENLGVARARSGRAAEGVAMLQSAAQECDRIRHLTPAPMLFRWAEACILAGQMEEALQLIRRAQAGNRSRSGAVKAGFLLGQVQRRRDASDAAVARQYLERAREGAEALQMRPLVARCWLELGQLHLQSGAGPRAIDELETAAEMLRRMQMPLWLEEAERALEHRAGA